MTKSEIASEVLKKQPFFKSSVHSLWEGDFWNLEELLPKSDAPDRVRSLDFSEIPQPWLRILAKKYLRLRSSSNGRAQLKVDLQGIRHFSQSLAKHAPLRTAETLCRQDVLNFISDIADKAPSSRIMFIGAVRNFLQRSAIEGWGVPDQNYVMRGDFPKPSKPIPRAIPEEVISKLEVLKDKMKPELARQVTILLGTGMRIVELVVLPFDCLVQDHVGDFFVRYAQLKMKEEHSVPVGAEVIEAIRAQQNDLVLWYKKNGIREAPKYLFVGRFGAALKGGGIPKPLPQQPSGVRVKLSLFAKKYKITDSNGMVWQFQPHQFRHTVGTRLINNGMSQSLVQKFFNHKSPNMTSRYCHVNDQTLKQAYAEAHGRLINIYGQIVEEVPENSTDLQWLKKNVLAQALPNGFCGLPVIKGGCPHANACLSCAHFRTDKTFLPEHKKQLQQTEKMLDVAKANHWERQVEINLQNQKTLKQIISSLEETPS